MSRHKTPSAARVARNKTADRLADPSAKMPTLAEFSEEWLRDYVSTECTRQTFKDYKWGLERHLLPALGHAKLDDVTREVADAFVERLLAERGFPTAQHGRRTLSAMYGVATKWGHAADNPVSRRPPPSAER